MSKVLLFSCGHRRAAIGRCGIFLFAASLFFGVLAGEAEAKRQYAAIVIDAHTGKTIYSRHANARRYPASLTKMMTLYVLFGELEAGRLKKSSPLKISRHAAAQPPSKLGLRAGSTIRVEDAIKALVTKSANDAAVVIAENIAGSEKAFARRMTQTARSIGMSRTTFRNASGLPDSGQVTTARDMARLGLRLQRDFPQHYHYFSLRSFTYAGRRYRSHNRLLGRFSGTDGIKTGYIRASGFNLTSSVRRGGKHLIGVVIGGRTSRSRDSHMEAILTRAFASASVRSRPPVRIEEPPVPVPNPNTLLAELVAEEASAPSPPSKPTIVAASVDPIAAVAAGLPVPRQPAAEESDQPTLDPAMATDLVATKVTPASSRPASSLNELAADVAENAGDWSIQVGAYARKKDALRRLENVRELEDFLAGKKGAAVPLRTSKQVLYRARFAGFDRGSAQRACEALERRSVNCLALAP